MKPHCLAGICLLLLSFFPVVAVCQEGYSSAQPSIPARIYYRVFTIYTHQEACEKSPKVSVISLRLPSTRMRVGDKIKTNSPDDSIVSDLVIEAFDEDGNFLPAVPVYVMAVSQGKTIDYDPGILYRDGSMDYWEARSPGKFDIGVSWACPSSPQNVVQDSVTIEVVDAEN
jgi:hypothetical protein